MSEVFGQRLARLRKQAGLKQGDLAKIMHVQQSFVSMLEHGGRHGEKVQAGTLLRIATRLGVSMEYLLTGRHRRDHEQGRSTDEKEYVHD